MPDLTLPFTFDNDPPDTNTIDADDVNANFAAILALFNGGLDDENFDASVKRQFAVKLHGGNYSNKGSGGAGNGTTTYGDVLTQMDALSATITCRGNPFLVFYWARRINASSPPEYKVNFAAAADGVADQAEVLMLSRGETADVFGFAAVSMVTPSPGSHEVGVGLRTDNAAAASQVYGGPAYVGQGALILELNRATEV